MLGVSGGAAVGAVVAVALHYTSLAFLPIAAFAGAAVAVTLVLLVARAAGARGDPRVLVMAGVVVGAFANAAVMVLLAGAPSETVRGAVWWMMGSLSDATWQGTRWIALYVAIGAALLFALGREIELLALGEDPAAALGVDVERATRRVYLAASLLARCYCCRRRACRIRRRLVVPALGLRAAGRAVGAERDARRCDRRRRCS